MSGNQIDSYNYETILLAAQQTALLTEEIKAARCALGRQLDGHPCDDVKGAFIHISLSNVTDATLRERLQAIPTGLTISDADVDSLVALGEKRVGDNRTLRDVLDAFSVQVAPAAASDRPGAGARPAG